MIIMPQIIAAVITGLFVFVALMVQHVLLSRWKKTEDVAGIIVPRRAELYRKLLAAVCGTGVQYEYETGGKTPKEKIVFLHETCNRAIYELSPFAGMSVINAVMKLSGICAKHRPLIAQSPEDEQSAKWQDFKYEFQFHFLDLCTLMRSDCMGEAIDKLIEDAKTRRYVKLLDGYPRNFGKQKKGRRFRG